MSGLEPWSDTCPPAFPSRALAAAFSILCPGLLVVGTLNGGRGSPRAVFSEAECVGTPAPTATATQSPAGTATDYGLAGPQFTTFIVVAPQIGSRLYICIPDTQNDGWIDVAGVGPVSAPAG